MRNIRLWLVCGFVSLNGHALGQEAESTPSKGPQLELRQTEVQVGTFWLDSPATGSFVVRNTGDQPLEIRDLSAARGVSAELQPPGAIDPNTSAKISVTFDGQALGAGRFEKSIFVSSNDPQRKRTRLKVAGECKHYVSVTPKTAGFGKLIASGRAERMLRIRGASDQPLQVQLDSAASSKLFSFQLIETIPEREFALYVNTKPPYPIGMHNESVRLRTNHPKQPFIEIDVFAVQPEPIEVLPKMISLRPTAFNGLDPSKPSTHVVTVTSRSEERVLVTSAGCTDKAVSVRVQEVYPGIQYRVLVEIPANYAAPETGADVLVETDSKEQPLLRVGIGRMNTSAVSQIAATPSRKSKDQKKKTRTKKRRPVLDTVGKPVPKFSLTTTVGTPLSNSELGFHPATVLNFVAPNCGFCKKQIPKVEKVREDYESQGVRFVNVAQRMRVDFEPDEIMSILGDLGPGMELAIDAGNRVGRRFKATAYPCLIVVRPDGVIDHVVSGNKRNIGAQLETRLQALLGQEAKPQNSD